MFTLFRAQYPTGSLISELLLVDRKTYIVRALVQVGGVTMASGMAAAPSIEQAEDQARQRAIAVLGIQIVSPPAPTLDPSTTVSQPKQTVNHSHPPTTTVSTSTQDSSFDHQSSHETVAADASITSNSNSDTTGDRLATAVQLRSPQVEQDADATGDHSDPTVAHLSDAEIWSASYDRQSSQTDPDGMSDETTQASLRTFDYLEVSNSITVELERVGWDEEKEKDYLQRFYGQRERSLLGNDELLEFLHYLQAYSQTTQELKRLDWTEKQGREHLEQTYNQRSRVLLSCQQLQEFLDYLQSQPQPNQGLF